MEFAEEVIVRKTKSSHINEVDWKNLEFGKYQSDHMVVCDYKDENWETLQVVPFANLSLSPTTLALHYGQTIFEGMKAFRMTDGRVNIFRPYRHYERFVLSAQRMCMAVIPRELFIPALDTLVSLDREWVPSQPGSSLYIRPFMFATEAWLKVKVSDEYRFMVVTGPTGPYYQQPLKLKVETGFVRAVKGGTGYAKCGGNYGGSFYPAQKAKEQGYDQVLWTDGRENKFLEESGTMNVMFVINGTLVTPSLSDSILDGVTRDSLLTLAEAAGIPVEVRPVSVPELRQAFEKNQLSEAFGCGTAAVASPIKTIGIDGTDYELPVTEKGVRDALVSDLEDIRTGRKPDIYDWNYIV